MLYIMSSWCQRCENVAVAAKPLVILSKVKRLGDDDDLYSNQTEKRLDAITQRSLHCRSFAKTDSEDITNPPDN